MYCWGKVRMSLVGISRMVSDLDSGWRTIVADGCAESARGASNLPEMEDQAGRHDSRHVLEEPTDPSGKHGSTLPLTAG